MNIEFDSAKNALNIKTHGISLADASLLDWDTIHVLSTPEKIIGELAILATHILRDIHNTSRQHPYHQLAKSELKRG